MDSTSRPDLLVLDGARVRRVAVLRALHLGDLLCAVPALRALRGALPDAHITLIGLDWSKSFADRFRAYINEWVRFPGYPGLPEAPADPDATVRFLEYVQSQHYDLALQMHGSGEITNPLVSLFGARASAGCYLEGHYCPDPLRFIPFPAGLSETHRWLELIRHLTGSPASDSLEFPLLPEDWAEYQELVRSESLPQRGYVCVHPGARDPRRRWAPHRFAAVADELASRGLRVVVTGTEDELEAVEQVRSLMRGPSLSLAGRTGLGPLACLLSKSTLLVSNDTGVSHLAAALAVPSVIVFNNSDPARWAPNSPKHVALESRLNRGPGRTPDAYEDGRAPAPANGSQEPEIAADEVVRAALAVIEA